jgi:hypothetical protein
VAAAIPIALVGGCKSLKHSPTKSAKGNNCDNCKKIKFRAAAHPCAAISRISPLGIEFQSREAMDVTF